MWTSKFFCESCGGSSRLDDPDSERRAGVAGYRAHGHAEGVCEPVAAGSGGASARSFERPSVLLSRSPRLHEETGTGSILRPSPADGAVSISPAQLGYLLSGIDWRHPQATWRPSTVG